jgi:hypothetical protein
MSSFPSVPAPSPLASASASNSSASTQPLDESSHTSSANVVVARGRAGSTSSSSTHASGSSGGDCPVLIRVDRRNSYSSPPLSPMLAHQNSDSQTLPNLSATAAAVDASRRHSSHSAPGAASSPLIGQRAPMQSSYLGQVPRANSGQGFESASATIAPDDISLDTRPLLAGAPFPMPPDSRSQNGASAGQPANQTPESRSGAGEAARDGGNGANPHETMFLGRANKVFCSRRSKDSAHKS